MTMLYCGTTQGWHQISVADAHTVNRGLPDQVVTQIAVRQQKAIAACPHLTRAHFMLDWATEESAQQHQQPGVWLEDLGVDQSKPRRIWEGNAKSCAFDKAGSLLAGVEPADVLSSTDDGATWQDNNSFRQFDSRSSWSYPAVPREPHVMSFDFAQDMHDPDGAPLMMVGIEVGGLLAYVPTAGAWQERNVLHTDDGQQQRLKDVHQVRPDPFDHSRWYCTAGETAEHQGGFFVTEDQGQSWRRLLRGSDGSPAAGKQGIPYILGLALNPWRQGELLITAANNAPGIGGHVLHSLDGGKTIESVTQHVTESGGCSIGGHLPVPYFIQEGAVLGVDTGDILISADAVSKPWRKLTRLSGAIISIAEEDRGNSAVMH